jgi:exodeoxyribonuclease-1
MKPAEIAELLKKYKYEEGELRLPVKQLQFNKCPAVAPLAVLTTDDKERLNIDMAVIEQNLKNDNSFSGLSNYSYKQKA